MNLPLFAGAAVACAYLAYALLEAGAGPLVSGALVLVSVWFIGQLVMDLIETAQDASGDE